MKLHDTGEPTEYLPHRAKVTKAAPSSIAAHSSTVLSRLSADMTKACGSSTLAGAAMLTNWRVSDPTPAQRLLRSNEIT